MNHLYRVVKIELSRELFLDLGLLGATGHWEKIHNSNSEFLQLHVSSRWEAVSYLKQHVPIKNGPLEGTITQLSFFLNS